MSEKRWPCTRCGVKLTADEGDWLSQPERRVMIWVCPEHMERR